MLDGWGQGFSGSVRFFSNGSRLNWSQSMHDTNHCVLRHPVSLLLGGPAVPLGSCMISLIMSKLTFSKRISSARSSCAEKTFIVQNSCFSNIPFSCSSFKKPCRFQRRDELFRKIASRLFRLYFSKWSWSLSHIPSIKASYVLRAGGFFGPLG